MCGIAGHVRRTDAADQGAARAQLDQLLHRGPDSVGLHDCGRAAFGQTRLAVIDLDTGDPPISTPDGSVAVALNGELYNYRELRAELQADGHTFRTSGDTEVLAHVAEGRSAADVAASIDGMFAFALWRRDTGTLVLGRDRLGKKPLHYWHDGTTFVFGSEIKAVLCHPAVPRRLDQAVLPAYLALGSPPSGRTFFEGVRSLPPGHVLELGPDFTVRISPYWTPVVPGMSSVRPHAGSLDEAAERTRELLDAAVQRRLVADVPLGAFLSGGIDSSMVVALMARGGGRPVKTFTIGFEDRDGFDERPYARMVADRWKTDHTEFVVRPQAVDLVEELVWHYDEPFGDSSAVPTYLLSRLTRQHVTVALSGDGGDELFAGYERFAAGVAMARLVRLPERVRRVASGLAGRRAWSGPGRRLHRVARFLEQSSSGMPAAYSEWISYVPSARRAALLGSVDAGAAGIESHRALWDATAGSGTLDRLLYLNLLTYLPDDLLVKVDRMSMAHALEVRSPFLDTALVEFALRLPARHKAVGLSLKRVLKRAARGLVPDAVLDRPKHGFSVPLDRWFREDLGPYAVSRLGDPGAAVRTYLDGAAVDVLLAEHHQGAASHGHALWTLLTLEVFLRKHGW